MASRGYENRVSDVTEPLSSGGGGSVEGWAAGRPGPASLTGAVSGDCATGTKDLVGSFGSADVVASLPGSGTGGRGSGSGDSVGSVGVGFAGGGAGGSFVRRRARSRRQREWMRWRRVW